MFQLVLNEGDKATDAGKVATDVLCAVVSNAPASTVSPAGDIDLSVLSLVSVGPYEDFAVSTCNFCFSFVLHPLFRSHFVSYCQWFFFYFQNVV